MANYFVSANLPFLIVANKCDKLNKTELAARPAEISDAFSGADILMYSAEKGTGRSDLLDRLNEWAGSASAN